MDVLDKTENFYIKNFQKLYNETYVKNIFYLFKIIEVFKDKSEFLYTDNEGLITTELDNDNDFPRLEQNNNIYSTTDIHGDLTSFLFSLLKSGVAKYKKEESSIIYFDLKENTIINNIEECIKNPNNDIKNLIPIPNLKINPNFNGKFVCTGDLLNRGLHTDSCFCLMYYLLNQDNQNKIEYIIGNHEDLILRNNKKLYNGNNFDLIRKSLFNLIKNNKLKFCIYSDKTIFSHTIFEKDYIIEGLYEIMGNEKFNEGISNNADNLLEKIENNTELNKNDIQNLSELFNLLFKDKIVLFEKDKEQSIYDSIFIKKVNGIPSGLLWSLNFKYAQQISGLYQVVGHEQRLDGPVLENGVIKSDIGQSSGINTVLFNGRFMPAYSNTTLLNFKNGICKVLQKVITVEYIEELYEEIGLNYRLKSTMENRVSKAISDIDKQFSRRGMDRLVSKILMFN